MNLLRELFLAYNVIRLRLWETKTNTPTQAPSRMNAWEYKSGEGGGKEEGEGEGEGGVWGECSLDDPTGRDDDELSSMGSVI